MPKLSGVKIAHRRAVNRLQVSGNLPAAVLRLEPGSWVKALRVVLHMTQRQLAKRAGVSQMNLVQIEKGRYDPNLVTLRKLFDAMFCDLILLPAPRKRFSSLFAEKTLEIPGRRMWD